MGYNLREKIYQSLEKNKDLPAVCFKKDNCWKFLTFGEFRKKLDSISNFLISEGVSTKEKIAIILENCPEWPIIFFSIVSIGAVAVPLSPGTTEREIENILADSETCMVFVSKQVLPVVEQIKKRTPGIKRLICVDFPTATGPKNTNRVLLIT